MEDKVVEADVKKIMSRMMEACAKKDVDAIMALVAHNENVVFIGSGEDEKVVGWKEIKAGYERDFAQADSIKITMPWVTISSAGRVAWVSADETYDAVSGGRKIKMEGRMTAVLEKRRGKWLIVQMHFSVPNVKQPSGRSFSIE